MTVPAFFFLRMNHILVYRLLHTLPFRMQRNTVEAAEMGHAYMRHRIIGTHISIPAEIQQLYCITDIRDNGYSRQEYPVPRIPM